MRYGVRYLVKRKRMGGGTTAALSITRLILEELAALGETTLGAFFPAKYPEARLWRKLLGRDASYHFKRESFSVVLSRLRAEGLIQRSGGGRRATWQLADKGWLRLRFAREPAMPARDGICRLVVFDIPERERRKRDVIRYELAAIGYGQLQKSVWYGERPLPLDFIKRVSDLGLHRYVHIFSVRDAGTLRPS